MAPRARAAAVLLAVALVAGCGDDDDDDAGADASTSTTTTEAADGEEETSSTTTTAAGSDGTSDSTPSTTGGGGTDDPDEPDDRDDPPEGDPEEAGEAPDVLTEADSGDTYRLAERRLISLRLSNPPTWGEPAVEGDAVSVQLQPYEVDPGFTEYVISADEPGRSVVRFTGDREVVLTFDVYEN